MSLPYFTTQKQKDEYMAKRKEALANLPSIERPIEREEYVRPPKPKKKRYNPPAGFRLGDAMPEELRSVGRAYREKRNRGKIYKSNNKGDQHYGKARRTNERTT